MGDSCKMYNIKKKGVTVYSKTIIQKVFISILLLYCIIFPADTINIKEILLFLCLFLTIPAIYKALHERHVIMLLFYGVFFPTYVIAISIARDVVVYDVLSYGYVWFFFLLVPAISYYDINIRKPIIVGTLLIAISTLSIAILDIFSIISFFENPIRLFFTQMNELQSGKGIYSTFGYSIFFKASPLIYFSLAYMVKNRKYIISLMLVFALFASGTRANAIIAIFIVVGTPILFFESANKKKIVRFIVVALCVAILPIFVKYMFQVSLLKSGSDILKINDMTSVVKFLNDDPLRYLLGSGIGSYFYSGGREKMVNITEVSYLDYFRQVGLIGFIPFVVFIFYPFFNISLDKKWLLVPYLGYLATAATNPLLISSTAFVVYILMYDACWRKNKIVEMKS